MSFIPKEWLVKLGFLDVMKIHGFSPFEFTFVKLLETGLMPGETGQYCLLNTIVSILNQTLPFCP